MELRADFLGGGEINKTDKPLARARRQVRRLKQIKSEMKEETL